LNGIGSKVSPELHPTAAIDPLLEVHAGFRTSRTVVLHNFGTDPNYDSWRSQTLRPSGPRNPGVSGSTTISRVISLPQELVIGKATSRIVTSVPGLNMTGVVQSVASGQAGEIRQRAGNLEIAANGCGATSSVDGRAEARIAEIRSSLPASNPSLRGAGKAMFASVGCADCHTATLGDVEGIYSDLLLHDMGKEMADEGSYSDDPDDGDDDPLGPLLSPGVANNRPAKSPARQSRRGTTRQEWRTPPLWGFRDSGPYLHDGRAQTLEQAVALHGGQGAASAHKFFELSPRERLLVEAFLKSLVALPSTHLAQRGD
jgi:mono/diheme cytochrome c family protein